jgi:hypothetical protein
LVEIRFGIGGEGRDPRRTPFRLGLERVVTGHAPLLLGVDLQPALRGCRYGVRVNCISPSMARTRLTLAVPGMSQEPPAGRFDSLHPAACAPVAAYLAGAACPLTGQVLSVRGGTVAVNHGWSLGAHIHKDGLWSVEELAEKVQELPMDDPFDKLAQALTGALGTVGRAQLQEMINALLDQGVHSDAASA